MRGRRRSNWHRPFWENAGDRRKTKGVSHSFMKIYRFYCLVSCAELLNWSPKSKSKTWKWVHYVLFNQYLDRLQRETHQVVPLYVQRTVSWGRAINHNQTVDTIKQGGKKIYHIHTDRVQHFFNSMCKFSSLSSKPHPDRNQHANTPAGQTLQHVHKLTKAW